MLTIYGPMESDILIGHRKQQIEETEIGRVSYE